MIHFEGVRTFSQPVSFVAAKLSDAAFLVGCLQNVERLVEANADRAVLKMRTGFSFLSTSLDVTLTVNERSDSRAIFAAKSRSVGASSTVQAFLDFRAEGEGTSVTYSADVVERTGFLKIVSSGLIQAAAKSVIEDVWKGIEAKLSGAN